MEYGICRQALTDYVIGALRARFDERGNDGRFPYYTLEDDKEVE